jgi:hypothetical protein
MELRLNELCSQYYDAVCYKDVESQFRILNNIMILINAQCYTLEELNSLIYTPLHSTYERFLKFMVENNRYDIKKEIRALTNTINECYNRGYSAQWKDKMMDVLLNTSTCDMYL